MYGELLDLPDYDCFALCFSAKHRRAEDHMRFGLRHDEQTRSRQADESATTPNVGFWGDLRHAISTVEPSINIGDPDLDTRP